MNNTTLHELIQQLTAEDIIEHLPPAELNQVRSRDEPQQPGTDHHWNGTSIFIAYIIFIIIMFIIMLIGINISWR